MTAVLQVNGVSIDYERAGQLHRIVHRVSFSMESSERYVLLGASGCGKSTLLKAIGGYISPSEGEIRVEGRLVQRPGPDRIMVFQEFDQLLPWKTVRDNVGFGLRMLGKHSPAARKAKVDAALEQVKLSPFANSYPHTLSGGMKQRVAIARALALEPRILLMDEPFAALDALTRAQMQEELLQLWQQTGFTLIFVTHSIREALLLGSRILIMTPQGQVKAEVESKPDREAMIHELLFGQTGQGKHFEE